MKKVFLAAAVLTTLALPAAAADYTVIHLETNVDRPADQVWARIGGFCAIKDWLGVTCAYTSGTGGIGTIRNLNAKTDEIMVASTPHSYTYTQPNTPILYHGTLAVEAIDPGHSRIRYDIFYDQAPLATPDAQAANRKQRTDRFNAALAKMKAMAEAQ